MTWTKLGDEFGDEACGLTDAEFRTHVEALLWSNKRLLDLRIPKRDVKRFAESPDAEQAIKGLAAKGWWEDCGDAWFVGLCFPEWQREREQVLNRREQLRIAQDRGRKHKKGDHSLCLPGKCQFAVPPSTVESSIVSTVDTSVESAHDPGRVGSGATHTPDPEDQTQGQDQKQQPLTNSHKPRVPQGPGNAG
jgi:hypothetical protein